MLRGPPRAEGRRPRASCTCHARTRVRVASECRCLTRPGLGAARSSGARAEQREQPCPRRRPSHLRPARRPPALGRPTKSHRAPGCGRPVCRLARAAVTGHGAGERAEVVPFPVASAWATLPAPGAGHGDAAHCCEGRRGRQCLVLALGRRCDLTRTTRWPRRGWSWSHPRSGHLAMGRQVSVRVPIPRLV